jgi:hypothetical protein
MVSNITIRFWKLHHAVHVSFARPVSFSHLPEAHWIMNCILLPKTERLLSNNFLAYLGTWQECH